LKLTSIFKDFLEKEKASSFILLACTTLSIIISNSRFSENYLAIWQYHIAGFSILHLINEGLMTIFFLLIGLELERELYNGELSNKRNALLPLVGAIGGMILPAIIYLFFNFGTPLQNGAGIPMATDIAFALAILSLLGKSVPASLKIFLSALAVIDDLGAIIIISIFYTSTISWIYLFFVFGIWGFLFILNRLKITNIIPYIIGGFFMWYCMLHSGVHSSISGIILAFVIPFGDGSEKSSSHIFQRFLHKPVSFFILPLFALANTAIIVSTSMKEVFVQSYSLGIMLGLVFGKVIGIFSFCYFGIRMGICKLPVDIKRLDILGAGFLGGIGFTMSIFITMLAFTDAEVIANAKFVIIISSIISGIIGYSILKYSVKDTLLGEE
jgi:Na+:H+ antiporter, NhaA family